MTQSITYMTELGSTITTGAEWRRGDRGQSYRYDDWTPADGTGTVREHIHAFNRHDYTRQYDGPYDSKCSCCYLGFGHSEQKHTRG